MSWPVFVFGVFLVVLAAPAHGCSPLPGGANAPVEGMGLKMAKSEIVVYGMGEKAIPDERFPHDNVYSMEFQVRCVFKKPPETEINHFITINEIGEIPGLCFATNITAGQPVIIYISQGSDKSFRPTFSANPGGSVHRDELIGLCDFNPEYPKNLDPNILEPGECDVDYDYEGTCHDPEQDEVEPELPPTDLPAPPSPPPPPADTSPVETSSLDISSANAGTSVKQPKEPSPPAVDGEKTTKTIDVKPGEETKNPAGGVNPPYQPSKVDNEGDTKDNGGGGGENNSPAQYTASLFILLLVTMLSVFVL